MNNNQVEPLATDTDASVSDTVETDRDFIERDQLLSIEEIQGDLIHGDKITVGNIVNGKGIVIGPGTLNYYEAADAKPPSPGDAPFKGLQFFDVDDAALFCGREKLTAQLVNHLRDHNFLAVVGASGSGKSSLVRAGVMAALKSGEPLEDGVLPPPDSEQWLSLLFTPGRQPLESLARALLKADLLQSSLQQTVTALRQDFDHLRCCLCGTDQAQNQLDEMQWLVVVDQFEELFSYSTGAEQGMQAQQQQDQVAFLGNLLTLVQATRSVKLIITLRADFYAHCAAFETLRNYLEKDQFYIGGMNQEELERAITIPAQQANWVISPELVKLILDDMQNQPGALPLLSHALLETWNRRSGRTLTLAGYINAGRVQGAIARTAETLYLALPKPQQDLVRTVFLQLTELMANDEGTRRHVRLDELGAGAKGKGILAILNVLTNARLITSGKAGESSVASVIAEAAQPIYVEITHEALIREWPRLGGWLVEYRNALLFRDRLDAALLQWIHAGQDEGALLRGRLLDDALGWRQQYPELASPELHSFIERSVALRQREEHRQLAEEQAQRQRTRLRTILLTAIGLLLAPTLYIGANLWMFNRKQQSPWQLTAFPSIPVSAIAANPQPQGVGDARICVGTADIGVGCTTDIETWNLYQAGLPRTIPSALDDRQSWWGYLTRNLWSTRMKSVEALTFDLANPQRLVAVIKEAGVYTRLWQEADWYQLSTTAPTTQVTEIAVYGAHMAILHSAKQGANGAVRGKVYYSVDNGAQWQTFGGEADASYGLVYDMALVSTPDPATSVLFLAADGGLLRFAWDTATLRGAAPIKPQDVVNNVEQPLLLANRQEGLYWLTVTSAEATKTRQIRIYRSQFNDKLELTPPQLWGEIVTEHPPYQMALGPSSRVACSAPPCLQLWLLFSNGSVARFEPGEQLQTLRYYPAWLPLVTGLHGEPWQTASGDRYLLLVAHQDGLIHYCPDLKYSFYLCVGDALAPQP